MSKEIENALLGTLKIDEPYQWHDQDPIDKNIDGKKKGLNIKNKIKYICSPKEGQG